MDFKQLILLDPPLLCDSLSSTLNESFYKILTGAAVSLKKGARVPRYSFKNDVKYDCT